MASPSPSRPLDTDSADRGRDPSTLDHRSVSQHPDRTAPEVTLGDLRNALATPGVLRSDAYLTVQTKQAQRLIEGRRADDHAAAIIGLTRFAALLRPVWNGARTDDPYADWWLVRVEDAIAESEQELIELKAHVEKALARRDGITIRVAESIEPLQVPLNFATPYSFRGAYLLALYDEVVRVILTARHVAYLDRDRSEQLLDDAGRHVRRAYLSSAGYRFLGINRQDIALMTARAKEASDEMGTLPQEIIDRTLRPAHGPQAATRRRFVLRSVEEPAVTEPVGDVAVLVTERDTEAGDGADAAASA